MPKAHPLKVKTSLAITRYKNRVARGQTTDPLIEQHGAIKVMAAMRAIEEAVAAALKKNPQDLRQQTLAALKFKPERTLHTSIGAIQHGPDQAVCSVRIQDPRAQFIVKGAFPRNLAVADEHFQEKLFAFEGSNFTEREFHGLRAAAQFSQAEGQVVAPITLVPSFRETTLYSQLHAPEGYFELNPTRTHRGWTFFYNEPAGDPRAHKDNRIESGGEITVLRRTIKLMTLICLRSQAQGNALLILPSFPAGDIMVNSSHEIRCVGLRNVYSFEKLYENYSNFEANPGSSKRVLCRYLDRVYSTAVFGQPFVLISRTGLREGLVNGVLGGFDQFHGGRSNHHLTPEIIGHYLDEATPG